MAGTVDLVVGYQELQDAQPSYVEADEYYDGSQDEIFSSAKVRQLLAKAQADQVDDFNYAKIPVDTVAEKLTIRAVTVTHAEHPGSDAPREQDTKLQRAQETLRQIQERTQFEAEYPDLHLQSVRRGDSYLFVWPVLDDSGQVTSVDMFVNSANNVRAIYDEENPLEVSYVIKAWEIEIPPEDDPLGKPDKRQRANLYYKDRIERWITKSEKPGEKLEDWEPYEPDDGDSDGDPGNLAGSGGQIPNPYGRPPFFHFRNGRPYGTPRHRSAYGPQQIITKLIQTHTASIDYLSFPQRYALVDPKQDDPLANLVDPVNPEDDDDDPESDYNASQLRADPAAVWRLRGMSSVGQFTPAGPEGFLSPFDRYVKAMSELCRIPLYKFGSSFAQPPSGTSLRLIDQSLNNEARSLHVRYGAVWADAFEFALQIMGVEDIRVVVEWQPVEVIMDQEGWAIVGLKVANGVPVRQALQETGYSAEQVDQWLPDAASQDLIRQVQLLGQIGQATQALGAGVGLGVLSQEQAAAVVQRVLGLAEKQGGAPEDKLPELPPDGYRSIGGKAELLEPKDPNPPPPEPMGPGGGQPPRGEGRGDG